MAGDGTPDGNPPARHEAKRSLGQNFLVDPNLQRKIVDAIDPGPDDVVLEIGPGQGALTRHLARRAGRLVLVELDDDLARNLQREFASAGHVEVIHRDILALDLGEVTELPDRLKVIGNIPYNLTTPIIFHLLERRPRPAEIVLMIQREVADRILSPPGGKVYGALAVGVQTVADTERVLNVGRRAFRPVPDVESTVIRIRPHAPPRLEPELEASVRTLTRAAFGQRRKQFQRILRDAFGLTPERVEALARDTAIDPRARPETLAPEAFIRVARALRVEGVIA
jgi:16S rRNA (adenine1518-N6/adenine1519-N6)-dimethyltransferase